MLRGKIDNDQIFACILNAPLQSSYLHFQIFAWFERGKTPKVKNKRILGKIDFSTTQCITPTTFWQPVHVKRSTNTQNYFYV